MKPEPYPLRLLSHCLYHYADRNEFNRYFNEYHECISKRLLPYIKGRLFMYGYRGDLDTAAADLWQDIFDEHYQSIFINRPKSAQRIQELTGSLKLTSRGELFSRQVSIWRKEVVDWVRTAMTFLNSPITPENDTYHLGQQAQEINHLRFPLRDQGHELLLWLLPYGCTHVEEESIEDDTSLTVADNTVSSESIERVDDRDMQDRYHITLKQRIAEISEIVEAEGELAADMAAGCEGGAKFGIAAIETLDQMPRTLIPVMSALYWLTNNRVKDYMRRVAKDPINNQLEESLHNDDDANEPDESFINRIPAESKESEKFLWNDVQVLLQKPIFEARAALQQTGLTNKQLRTAEAKLLQCEERYRLNLDVLGFALEGYSEEAIASQLSLTRDQVRGRKKEIRQLLESLRDLRH